MGIRTGMGKGIGMGWGDNDAESREVWGHSEVVSPHSATHAR